MEYKTIDGKNKSFNLGGLSNSRTSHPNKVMESVNNGKQQLNEYTTLQYTIINEGKAPNAPMTIRGIFQRAGQKNQNGRVYGKEILMREVAKYSTNFIGQNRAMGELDHPESSIVSLQNVSHIIRGLSWNGDDLIGEIEILPTPNGNILKNLLQSGVAIGISSRGMGTTKKDMAEGVEVVQPDFELIAFDIVSNPSIIGAGFNLNESVDLTIEASPIIEVVDVVKLEDTYHDILMSHVNHSMANYRQS